MYIGGNSINSVINVSNKFLKYKIPVINYAVESVRDNSLETFSEYDNLLKKINSNYKIAIKLTSFNLDLNLINNLIERYIEKDIKILIDAEMNKYNNDYNIITRELLERYNKHNVNLYKTYQMYRKDSIITLMEDMDYCYNKNIYFGSKLVRGAYWNSENNLGHLFTSKFDTDKSYNNGVINLYEYKGDSENILATHNTESINIGMLLNDRKRIFSFAHLLDMKTKKYDNVLKEGHDVHVYIPYGPYKEMIPYLGRRLYENIDTFKYLV